MVAAPEEVAIKTTNQNTEEGNQAMDKETGQFKKVQAPLTQVKVVNPNQCSIEVEEEEVIIKVSKAFLPHKQNHKLQLKSNLGTILKSRGRQSLQRNLICTSEVVDGVMSLLPSSLSQNPNCRRWMFLLRIKRKFLYRSKKSYKRRLNQCKPKQLRQKNYKQNILRNLEINITRNEEARIRIEEARYIIRNESNTSREHVMKKRRQFKLNQKVK